MALRLVRKTSETPNITNKDDVVSTRYAYGGYNGIVKDFGNSCNYYSDNGIFRILSGRILIDGWEIDVDGAGWSLDLSNVAGMQYHSIYAEINVSIESVEIKSTYLTGNYPEITKGDDLTAVPNGTARLLLYQVWVQNGRIVSAIKKFEDIPYLTQKVLDIEKELTNKVIGQGKPLYQYNESEGTVEERLTRLGFKSGAITFCGKSYSPDADNVADATQGLFRQGNYVIGKLKLTNTKIDIVNNQNIDYIFGNTFSSEFRPKKDATILLFNSNSENFTAQSYAVRLLLHPDGTIERLNVGTVANNQVWVLELGYEAEPITKGE